MGGYYVGSLPYNKYGTCVMPGCERPLASPQVTQLKNVIGTQKY